MKTLNEPRLSFDAGQGLWIASRKEVIQEVLDHPHCLVRPPAEPVPRAIAGNYAGAVFARLVRMNDGADHAAPKRAIASALASLQPDAIAASVARWARVLAERHGLPDGAALGRWVFDLPTCVVADLLGFPHGELPQITAWVADFVRCLSPLSSAEQLAAASMAAQGLRHRFTRIDTPTGLMAAMYLQAGQEGWVDRDAILANLVGLLSQTHEATAGLIGNSIVAMLREPSLQARLRADSGLAAAHVEQTARRDPPVRNTRRFVVQETSVAGVALRPGDTILLQLSAGDGLGFGHGRHACPGQSLAVQIATGGMAYLLSLPLPLNAAALGWTYRPSANARLPEFFGVQP